MSRLALFALLPALLLGSPALAANDDAWHRVVGVLQYLEADYPLAVESGDAFELAEQKSFAREAVEALQDLGPTAAPFVSRMEGIRAKVDAGSSPEEVSRACGELAEDLVLAGGLMRSPRTPPDLALGERTFAVACASCHGADGKAEVAIAAGMEPMPANFHDAELMEGSTPYKAFNTTSFGVTGTAMPAYPTLSEEERWSVAFHLFTLRQPPCDHTPPQVSLEALATMTDPQLAAIHGASEVACLRRTVPDLDEERLLTGARTAVEEALRLAAAGDPKASRAKLLDAYLTGLEPVEARMRVRSSRLVDELERAFLRTREAVETQSPTAQDEGRKLIALLDAARHERSSAPGFLAVLGLTILILLREGFEASIVVAALLAALKKMGSADQARVVHAGWISALIVGALAFVLGRHLIAGANQELLEGVIALVAVAMLLYAALWLNSHANTRAFMGELRQKVAGALSRGSMLGLFTVAFSAVLRESVETAIFLQGLAADNVSAVVWGSLIGAVLLLGMVLGIRKLGSVLPMQTLFRWSTIMLVATAVMLLGKGLHALQKVGQIPLSPIGSLDLRVDFLGLYPDFVTLVPQLVLIAAPFAWRAWSARRAARAVADTTVG